MVALRCKLLVVGDPGVGKSAITQVFHSDGSHYPGEYNLTSGVDCLVKTVNIPDTEDSVELYIYDCAGSEWCFQDVQKYWEGANMVMCVYDVTSDESCTHTTKWIDKCTAIRPEQPLKGCLVANKSDLEGRRKVKTKRGRELAKRHGLEYFECSAASNQGVEIPFYYLASAFHSSYKESCGKFEALVK
eukprot:Nk52_evm114s226 gene=Nk52_evmTU114s226